MTLALGDKAPDFNLKTDTGDSIGLHDCLGKIVVLYFYPRDDTPGCTVEAIDFSALAKDFAKAEARVIGVSKDSLASHAKFRSKHDLTVQLGSDPEGKVIEAFGAWVEKSMYGKKYMGIDRSTILIDRKGKIARIWRKVKVKGHAAEVLAAAISL